MKQTTACTLLSIEICSGIERFTCDSTAILFTRAVATPKSVIPCGKMFRLRHWVLRLIMHVECVGRIWTVLTESTSDDRRTAVVSHATRVHRASG